MSKIKLKPKTKLKKLVAGSLIALVFLCLGFASYSSSNTATAAVGINHQINFQGKLVTPTGTNVADGSYSVVFSIYNVASAGSNLWTETQTLTVTNGIFQVNLGSVTTLPASIDFNTDNIYLGIKVGADAEMTPRIQFTSVPQAFNSEKLGGLDKTGFIQNTTSQQASSNFNISGTGIAGILQAATVDTSAAGALSIGITNATSLSVAKAGVATTVNGSLTVTQATSLSSTLTVTGSSTFNGNVSVTGTNSLTVGTGATSLGGTLAVTGAITGSSTISGTTLNGTTGINTGAGAGTQRIDASGNLKNIGDITTTNTYSTDLTRTVPVVVGTEVDLGVL